MKFKSLLLRQGKSLKPYGFRLFLLPYNVCYIGCNLEPVGRNASLWGQNGMFTWCSYVIN